MGPLQQTTTAYFVQDRQQAGGGGEGGGKCMVNAPVSPATIAKNWNTLIEQASVYNNQKSI